MKGTSVDSFFLFIYLKSIGKMFLALVGLTVVKGRSVWKRSRSWGEGGVSIRRPDWDPFWKPFSIRS